MYDPQCFVTTFQAAYSGQLLQLPDLRQLVSDGKTMQPTKTERKKQGGSIKRTRVASTGEFGSKKRKGKRGATSRKHPRNKSGPSKGSDDLTWLGPTACATILDQIGALGRLLDEAEGFLEEASRVGLPGAPDLVPQEEDLAPVPPRLPPPRRPPPRSRPSRTCSRR